MDSRNEHVVVVTCDDAAMRAVLRFLILDAGYAVAEVDANALAAFPQLDAAALLILVANPAENGVALMAALHRAGHRIPTVLLAHGADATTRRRAFSLAALDIVNLPASPHTLQARLHTALGGRILRKSSIEEAETIRAGGLILHTGRRVVSSDGLDWSILLTKRETTLLASLMRVPGHAIERHTLLDAIWGVNYDGDGNALEVYVRRLRGKLASPASQRTYIDTLRGRGYRFDARRVSRPLTKQHAATALLRGT